MISMLRALVQKVGNMQPQMDNAAERRKLKKKQNIMLEIKKNITYEEWLIGCVEWLRKYDLEGTSVGLPKLKCKKNGIEKKPTQNM